MENLFDNEKEEMTLLEIIQHKNKKEKKPKLDLKKMFDYSKIKKSKKKIKKSKKK